MKNITSIKNEITKSVNMSVKTNKRSNMQNKLFLKLQHIQRFNFPAQPHLLVDGLWLLIAQQ